MKTLKIIIIVALLIFIAIFWIEHKQNNKEIAQLENLYSQTQTENDSLKRQNNQLQYKYDTLEQISLSQETKIDSLDKQIYLDRNKPCDHRLALEKELSKQLKYSLKVCTEQKSIQTVRYANLASINVNNEVFIGDCMKELKVVQSDNKKKKVLRWVERGGWLLLIALIVI
jgi:cell division protein FtsB